tara:strand:- start:24022 stop:24894 length:873 start_codon:yes stop_codon:yes gene_type:complete
MKNLCILVEIKGGFGNQIFQFVFANQLKDEGYNVFINTEYFKFNKEETKDNTYRKLIIKENIFGLKKINVFYLYFFKILKKINESRKLSKLFKRSKFPYFIKLKDSNFDKKLLDTKFVHLDGYWQNVDNLVLQKEFLIEALSKIDILEKPINFLPQENTVMLLIRRGDYIKMKEDLSLDFYKKCIETISDKLNKFDLSIFTDDVQWVKEQKIFDSAKNVFGPEDEPEKVLDLFSKMLQNKHFIVANSTFSLIAAFVKQMDDSIIIVSDPWFRNKEKEKLFLDNWIKIPNE